MFRIAIISSQAYSLVNFRGPMIRALSDTGVEVFALAPDFSAELRSAVSALGAVPIDCGLARAGMNPKRDLVDIFKLACLLKDIRPDATFGYFIKPVIYGSIASKLAGVGKRFSMIEGLGYVFSDDSNGSSLHRRALRYFVSKLYKLSLRFNEKVFFLNADDVNSFTTKNIVKQKQVMQLDGIGLELEKFPATASVKEPVTFLLVARMLREKGVYEFIEASRIVRLRHPCARFLLVGGTDSNPESISERELLGWASDGSVEWPGQVADVRSWIAKSSVFVLPSFYREGLPRSTQEAMAMGRPVITTDSPGCRDTVIDEVNGYLIPPQNSAALAAAMTRFIDNPELITTMGLESRRMAESRFDVNKINQQILGAMGICMEGSQLDVNAG